MVPHFSLGHKKNFFFPPQLLLTARKGIRSIASNSNASFTSGGKSLQLQICRLISFYLQNLVPSSRRAMYFPSRNITVLFTIMYLLASSFVGCSIPTAWCTQTLRIDDTQSSLKFPFTEEQRFRRKFIRHTSFLKEILIHAL